MTKRTMAAWSMALFTIALLSCPGAPAEANDGEPVMFQGFLLVPLGDAVLTPYGDDSLVVSNIGQSGIDGFTADLPPDIMCWLASVKSMDVSGLPVGAYLESSTVGEVDGSPQPVGRQTTRYAGASQLEMIKDFSPINATSTINSVTCGGSPVFEEETIGPVATWGLNADDVDEEIVCEYTREGPNEYYYVNTDSSCIDIETPVVEPEGPAGTDIVQGNAIFTVAQGTPAVDQLISFDMRAAMMPSFTVTELKVLYPPTSTDCEFLTVVIDSATTLPVATGFIPDSANVHYVIQAEGAAQRVSTTPTSEGWFDASGQTRLLRAGQIFSNMPFGALIGEFGASLANGFYVGDGGVFRAQQVDIGNEFILGLNMSAADQASMNGLVVAHVTQIPGAVEYSTVSIDSSTSLPIGTGLTADDGNDEFIVFAKGASRVVGIWPVTEGWFDPSGEIRLRRAGMIESDMPYGSVLGRFGDVVTSIFFVGDGGGFSAQPADLGRELNFRLNMDATDQAAMDGGFVITAIKCSGSVTAVEQDPPVDPIPTGFRSRSFPNPSSSATTIRFATSEPSRILLRVYDVSGRWVRTLLDSHVRAGPTVVNWDGRDDRGRNVASGVYFYQISGKDHSETYRLTLLR